MGSEVYSVYHLQSAYLFTLKAADIENRPMNDISPREEIEHQAYVSAAVLLSAAFLEAAVNELFYDPKNEFYGRSIKLSAAAKEAMIEVWNKAGTGRSPLLKKSNFLLRAAGKEQFKEREPVYEDASNLIKLKNLLVHYQPESFLPEEERDLEGRLSGRFNFNGIAKEGSRFFPEKCLGYGCAVWAIRSALNYGDEFMRRLGLVPVLSGEFEKVASIFRRDA